MIKQVTGIAADSQARAGVRGVALRSGGHSDSRLSAAIAIYDDVADLLSNFETSVFASVAARTAP